MAHRASALAFKPAALVTGRFIAYAREQMGVYAEENASLQHALFQVHDFNFKHKDSSAAPLQREASLLYDELLGAARECTLVIAYCKKNHAFMPQATKHLSTEKWFAAPCMLERELTNIKRDLFAGISILESHLSKKTKAYRNKNLYRGDHFCMEVLKEAHLREDHFQDWLEFNFFRRHRVPLGSDTCSADIQSIIERQMKSDVFCRRTVARIEAAEIQNKFPGVSLNGAPTHDGHFNRLRPALAAQLRAMPGEPYATVLRFTG